jgi:carboxyl-terminal processing protease
MNLPLHVAGTTKKRSAAKITIQKYYLPSGGSTQIDGVRSDISMDSINMHLPIGESDLDNALEWDQIPAANFRRPKEEFVCDPDNVVKLRELSQSRQKTSSEFLYLKENISWFRKKRETKTLSLNLSTRISQKKSDEEVSKALRNTFKSLSEKAFPLRKEKLQVVKDQTQKSLKARGEEAIIDGESSKNKLEKPKELDIRLHESVRIMVDWLNMLEGEQVSQKNLPE